MAEIIVMENTGSIGTVRSPPEPLSDCDYNPDTDESFEEQDQGYSGDLSAIIIDLPDLSNSQMAPVWQVMSGHGAYLYKFLSAHNILVHSNSAPLPTTMRHMIGIMATARLSCSYLMHHHRTELRRAAGPGISENGLEDFPAKIRKLSELNMVLAHRPWQMTRDHVAELTKPGTDSWSLSELVYSIILMCHFHSLSSFVMSCVMMEPMSGSMMGHGCSPGQDSYKVESLMRKMSRLHDHQDSPPPQEELQSRFYNIRSQTSDSDACDHSGVIPDISLYVSDTNFQYVDFAKRQDEFATFRIQDFTWDEEGYSTIARFDEDTAEYLDDKFRTIYNLTYGTMGSHTSIDTTLFRRASWNYIQCVWGIRHDDYDYHEVNELLHRDLKKYIKTSSCYPDRCTKSDYENIMKDFEDSEKVHIMMLVAEAKFQSSLLYAMRAVSEYYNTS